MGALPALEAERLSRLFGSVPALIELNLAVSPGSVCAVLGRNGAGKTTLLRVFATALRPTGGSARVFGRDVVGSADAVRALVDLLPAHGGVYPELSAYENLRFAARMRSVSSGESTVREALAWAGLLSVAEAPARTLSTGMTRRLGLARLRIGGARLLLFDEPYGSVDEEGRDLVDELLAEARASGRAALVASHSLERLEEVADEVIELDRGSIRARQSRRAGLSPQQTRIASNREGSREK